MLSDGIALERVPFGFWECTGSFLEVLVQHHFVYRTYKLRKYVYTDHIVVKKFLLKINFTNKG